jgi:hypothetical protein
MNSVSIFLFFGASFTNVDAHQISVREHESTYKQDERSDILETDLNPSKLQERLRRAIDANHANGVPRAYDAMDGTLSDGVPPAYDANSANGVPPADDAMGANEEDGWNDEVGAQIHPVIPVLQGTQVSPMVEYPVVEGTVTDVGIATPTMDMKTKCKMCVAGQLSALMCKPNSRNPCKFCPMNVEDLQCVEKVFFLKNEMGCGENHRDRKKWWPQTRDGSMSLKLKTSLFTKGMKSEEDCDKFYDVIVPTLSKMQP